MTIREIHGCRVLLCPAEGPALRSDRDAVELISEAFSRRAGLIAVPVERFHPDFFRLKTRLAGEFVQKFVNYRVRLAIVGDISHFLDESSALRDFARETNQGDRFWCVPDMQDLEARLKSVESM